MKHILTIFCFTLGTLVFQSSKPCPVWEGIVVDNEGEAVAQAYILVHSATDSTLLSSSISDEHGRFSVSSDDERVIVEASMIGFKSVYSEASPDMKLVLSPEFTSIEGAVVTATRPLNKLTKEGIMTTVTGSVLEHVGNANDLMVRVPGIVKGQDGIEVLGKGAPLVYINGMKVVDKADLERLQSDQIQSIELITNPGAQYDASVKSVIRIKTIPNGEGFGYNLVLKGEQSLHTPHNTDPFGQINANYRKNNVDIFGGVTHSSSRDFQLSHLIQETFGSDVYKQDQDLLGIMYERQLNLEGGANWAISDAHSIGGKLKYNKSPKAEESVSFEEDVFKNGSYFDRLSSNMSTTYPDVHSIDGNIYYNGKVGKLGIDLNADYVSSRLENVAHTLEISRDHEDSQANSSSMADNKLLATKLVLTHPLWGGSLQFGTEETFTDGDNWYNIDNSVVEPSKSNFREDNIAGFATYFRGFGGHTILSAGVRYEHVNYDYDDQLGNEDMDRKYDNWFPQLSISSQFGNMAVQLSYRASTTRPSFSDLNGAIRYYNRYSYQSGNYKLQPQMSNNVDLSLSWKFMTLMSSYSQTKDAIILSSRLYGQDKAVLFYQDNLPETHRQLLVLLNASPKIGVWSMNYNAGIQTQWLDYAVPDPANEGSTKIVPLSGDPVYILQMFNTFTLNEGWQLEAGGNFHSMGSTFNHRGVSNYFDLSFAVQKTLLRDKSLVVRLEGHDLTDNVGYHSYFDSGLNILDQTSKNDYRRLILTLRYRFNTAKSKYKGTGAGNDTRSRM